MVADSYRNHGKWYTQCLLELKFAHTHIYIYTLVSYMHVCISTCMNIICTHTLSTNLLTIAGSCNLKNWTWYKLILSVSGEITFLMNFSATFTLFWWRRLTYNALEQSEGVQQPRIHMHARTYTYHLCWEHFPEICHHHPSTQGMLSNKPLYSG